MKFRGFRLTEFLIGKSAIFGRQHQFLRWCNILYFIVLSKSKRPVNMVLLAQSEQFQVKSAHIRSTTASIAPNYFGPLTVTAIVLLLTRIVRSLWLAELVTLDDRNNHIEIRPNITHNLLFVLVLKTGLAHELLVITFGYSQQTGSSSGKPDFR